MPSVSCTLTPHQRAGLANGHTACPTPLPPCPRPWPSLPSPGSRLSPAASPPSLRKPRTVPTVADSAASMLSTRPWLGLSPRAGTGMPSRTAQLPKAPVSDLPTCGTVWHPHLSRDPPPPARSPCTCTCVRPRPPDHLQPPTLSPSSDTRLSVTHLVHTHLPLRLTHTGPRTHTHTHTEVHTHRSVHTHSPHTEIFMCTHTARCLHTQVLTTGPITLPLRWRPFTPHTQPAPPLLALSSVPPLCVSPQRQQEAPCCPVLCPCSHPAQYPRASVSPGARTPQARASPYLSSTWT